MDDIKPSEALFVRSLLPHCKRMGAVWLRNTKVMKERYRDHKIKQKAHGNNNIKDRCVGMRDKDDDLAAMVTVLRKIYKEVHSSSVMALIRCWLSLSQEDNVCVLTRGDTRGRMRRIDGGKGPDKVWRLDTLIGMLYHGLPLTSADSSMVYHICKHELCIRPQHLRIKLSSLSVVLVLKALSQAGYSITKNDCNGERSDEFVDISGPFTIQRLDVLRHEFVKTDKLEHYKLATSPDDYFILEQNPSLKKYYMVQSKRNHSPVSNVSVKSPNAYKRHLLFRLIDDSKKEKLLLHSQSITDSSIKTLNMRAPTNLLRPRSCQRPKIHTFNNTAPEPMDGEETELIEIMTSQEPMQKGDWMDSMLSDIPRSPARSALDKLIRDIIRSGSCSDKDSRDSKVTGDCKLWNSNKNELDDVNYELFDILNNMRSGCKSDISFKMTPNIFSPISDIEELQAAE